MGIIILRQSQGRGVPCVLVGGSAPFAGKGELRLCPLRIKHVGRGEN